MPHPYRPQNAPSLVLRRRERPTMVGQSSSKAAMKKRKAEAAKAKGRQEKGKRRRALATQGQGDAMAGYHLT